MFAGNTARTPSELNTYRCFFRECAVHNNPEKPLVLERGNRCCTWYLFFTGVAVRTLDSLVVMRWDVFLVSRWRRPRHGKHFETLLMFSIYIQREMRSSRHRIRILPTSVRRIEGATQTLTCHHRDNPSSHVRSLIPTAIILLRVDDETSVVGIRTVRRDSSFSWHAFIRGDPFMLGTKVSGGIYGEYLF